jgi:Zn-dependent protease with chaperone function
MVDSPYPYAESRENGSIVVTTGFSNLLERKYPEPAKRVQAWATVLAHEMAHDLSDHVLRRRDFPASSKSDRPAFVDKLAIAALQRRFELEADRVGNIIAGRAGLHPLDPVELRDLLETMRGMGKSFPPGLDPVFLKYSGSEPSAEGPAYSQPHPSPDTRMRALEATRK